ncbi:MAG TPA: tetratricopeptide repeat protein, partial [Candidatus Krumholzibacteria bacterium]|nr:tetratricopeptide repeat protein [Candidatus Krumholzibacteria bacterium]
MSKSIRFASAALALAVFVAACGTDEETFNNQTVSKNEIKTTSAPVVETTTETPVAVSTPVVEATYETSETAFLEGRYDEAFDLFTRYAARRPENPWGHYMLGMSAWKSGRLDDAQVAFNRAIELDSTLVKAHLNLARVLLEAHQPTAALAAVESALAIDGASSAARRLQGNAYHSLGQTEDALSAYRVAIQIDPEDAWSMNNLAFILIEEGRYDEALPVLARATELRKDVPVFFNNLGMVLERTGHYRAAEDAYTYAGSLEGVSERAIANRERVRGVREQPGLEPVDLAALARQFEAELKGNAAVATDAPSAEEPSLSVNPADTTSSAQQP